MKNVNVGCKWSQNTVTTNINLNDDRNRKENAEKKTSKKDNDWHTIKAFRTDVMLLNKFLTGI